MSDRSPFFLSGTLQLVARRLREPSSNLGTRMPRKGEIVKETHDFEELTRRLTVLAETPVLSKGEHKEAVETMRQLKRDGMSNEQIARLSGERWSASTVKGYTKGVRSAADGQWQDAVDVMKDVMSGDLSLEEVAQAAALKTKLAHSHVSVDDVVLVMDAAHAASTDVRQLVELLKKLNEHGLSPKKAAEALTLKETLNKQGLSMESLPKLAQVAQEFGGIEGALNAVAGYGSLKQLEEKTKAAEERLSTANEQFAAAEKKLAETRSTVVKERKPLEALSKARSLGFGEAELTQLNKASERVGGPKAVFKVFDDCAALIELGRRKEKAMQDVAGAQAMIRKLAADYSHLKEAVELCSSLIRDYGFGLDAIATVHFVAQRYGSPTVVLKALETYGNVQSLHDREQQLEKMVQEKERSLEKLKDEEWQATDMIKALHNRYEAISADAAQLEKKVEASVGLSKVKTFLSSPSSLDFKEGGPTALAVAVALREWSSRYRSRLARGGAINFGLDVLIGDLGG